MGLFDFLTGKKAPGLSSWQAEVRRAKKQRDFDWHNEAGRALGAQLLAQAAPVFGGKVRDLPEEYSADLRGTYDATPIRFSVRYGGLDVTMMCENRTGSFIIDRDLTKVPKKTDADDPWAKGDSSRIFLAKGVFVEGDKQDLAEMVAAWSTLPTAVQERVFAEMERLDVHRISASTAEVRAVLKPGIDELSDPIEYMRSCARLLAELKNALSQAGAATTTEGDVQVRISGDIEINGVRASGHVQRTGPATPLKCKYCSSLFVLAQAKNTCPNCGAPATR